LIEVLVGLWQLGKYNEGPCYDLDGSLIL